MKDIEKIVVAILVFAAVVGIISICMRAADSMKVQAAERQIKREHDMGLGYTPAPK